MGKTSSITIPVILDLHTARPAETPTAATTAPPKPGHGYHGVRCLIRTRISGVSIGIVDSLDVTTRSVVLSDAVRVWSWADAFTCSEIAAKGAACRIDRHPDGILIVDEGMEVIPVLDTAWADIQARWTVGRK